MVESCSKIWYNSCIMISVTPLFSGSKGNCTLIRSNNTNILLDIGFGYKAILSALEKNGLKPKDISAIIITHEHADHIGALAMWTKYCRDTLVYVPCQIADYVTMRSYCANVCSTAERFVVGDIQVEPYVCSHDSIVCLGYRFCCGGQFVASITDTGFVSAHTVDFLAPCRTIILESNHDVEMVKRGPYPYPLKQRILSERGHLSNQQATQLLSQLIGSNVKNVLLAHLSEQNNTKELAFSSAVNMYAQRNLVEGRDINIYVVDQYHNEVTIE